MKKVNILIVLVAVALLSFGCATGQKPIYSWGGYSSTLYAYKKAPSEETMKAHKEALLSIMDESKKENLRVPPGVYCEYGYILLKEGKKDEAMRFLNLERETYPESAVFIERLISKTKEKE